MYCNLCWSCCSVVFDICTRGVWSSQVVPECEHGSASGFRRCCQCVQPSAAPLQVADVRLTLSAFTISETWNEERGTWNIGEHGGKGCPLSTRNSLAWSDALTWATGPSQFPATMACDASRHST